ncbi:diguanylate cyclase [Mycobacterium sp. NPDC050551]|uniref:sensor domain-containing protein n=1 Tax=Mycobacterium sp. NPDC050551 TaxID=3155407 RepID=UPI003424D576
MSDSPPSPTLAPRADGELLRPGEPWYRQLVEQSPDGICVTAAGRVTYVNAAGVRLMGAETSAELVGRPISDFVTGESMGPMLADLAEVARPGDCSPHLPAEMIRSDGTTLAVEVVAVKLGPTGTDSWQIITRDVSVRHAAQSVMRNQAALVNHVSDAIIGTTADGTVTSWNPAAEAIYGRSAADAVGLPVAVAVGADLRPAWIVASGGVVADQHCSAGGHILDVRVSAATMAEGYVLVCCDLTALHRAEQHFEAVVTSMIEGLIVTDMHGTIKSINPAGLRILGAPEGANLVGVNFFEATEKSPFYDENGVNIAPEDRPALAVLRTGVSFDKLVYGWDRPEGRGWILSSCRLLNPDKPGLSDMLVTFTDVTAQRAEAEEMKFLATHDGLTSLPNRAAVLLRINDALSGDSGDVRLRAVLFIDVDHLKTTNDTHGHDAGDHVLRTTAERLRRTVAADDVVGRWGGDEFVVLVCRAVTSAEIDDLVDRLHSALALPAVQGPIGASIGVVEVDRSDRRTADELLRDADLAMYEAKRARGRRRSR